MSSFPREVARGQRFEFGRNWGGFLRVLDEDRIAESMRGLQRILQCADLSGCSFVDVGSGSGLSSLAALRLGAARVHSFDFDPSSVACTAELRRRYFPNAANWTIEEGSALDTAFLDGLGQFDVVYSWGVLHHTGALWSALGNVIMLMQPEGKLAIALYNDQGRASVRWRRIKQAYNVNPIGKWTVLTCVGGFYTARQVLGDVRRGRNPVARIGNYKSARGMSWWHDLVDWMGGLPFEVASVQAVEQFYRARGLRLQYVNPTDGWGNNEFLLRFERDSG